MAWINAPDTRLGLVNFELPDNAYCKRVSSLTTQFPNYSFHENFHEWSCISFAIWTLFMYYILYIYYYNYIPKHNNGCCCCWLEKIRENYKKQNGTSTIKRYFIITYNFKVPLFFFLKKSISINLNCKC